MELIKTKEDMKKAIAGKPCVVKVEGCLHWVKINKKEAMGIFYCQHDDHEIEAFHSETHVHIEVYRKTK